jgi:drug/metabolite transporter (DMT)-like permease
MTMAASFKLGNIRRGGALALLAAALFGASTPAAKAILGDIHPLMLAGLLYLGSGTGLTVMRLAAGPMKLAPAPRLTRQDLPWLLGTIVFGGVIGPALLMIGLTTTTGSTASLLLTLEGVFTALIAWIAFKEPFNRRIGLGMAAIFAGAVLLTLQRNAGLTVLPGTLAVIGACLAWGLDNNCTQKISHADAATIAGIKGLTAGVVNLALAAVLGAHLPDLSSVGAATLVGFTGYGVSLVLFVLALREIGAARAGAYFSTAPFIGAVVGLGLLRESMSINLGLAGGLMALGVWMHLTEPAPAN